MSVNPCQSWQQHFFVVFVNIPPLQKKFTDSHENRRRRRKMLVHWKSLITFGFIFWVVLCLTDLFGQRSYKHVVEESNVDLYYSEYFSKYFTKKLLKFCWCLVLWTTLTILLSVLVCSSIRVLLWVAMEKYQRIYKRKFWPLKTSPDLSSRIPVMVRSASRLSDTALKARVTGEASCPNLLPRRASDNLSHIVTRTTSRCRTIFRNNLLFSRDGENSKSNELAKLREEMARMQAHALKDHAALSRKLEEVTNEKKETARHLGFVQKENRAAKQQLEEMMQEKGYLIKKLENATKEMKSNTRTKKIALNKLEELTGHMDTIKRQLEQVSRDKEILENKLAVLQEEHEKLRGRLAYQENAPVRDTNGKTHDAEKTDQTGGSESENHPNTSISVSQAELDMKKIEIKIKQLERNLENFSSQGTDMDMCNGESDISLSVQGNNSETPPNEEETEENSEVYSSTTYSPSLRYWGNRAGDVIHAIAHRVNDKIRGTDDCLSFPEYPSSEDVNDDNHNTPRRIVSSSLAFQNFLRNNLQPFERMQVSHSDMHF